MEWLFYYSVVAVRRLAVSFTLKGAEFSVSTLLHHQHCHSFYVRKYIPPVFFIAYFLQQNLKVLVRFFHVNCMSQWDRRELISIVE
jgi:penicillin-binding protein-related factor A (putative recombinase)